MSFREKSAWISLLSTLGIYGLYFRSVFHSGLRPGPFHFGRLLATIIALVVVQVVLTVAVAIFTPKEANAPPDEREILIDLKAARFGYSALSWSVACACLFGGLNPAIIFPNLPSNAVAGFSANALLFILVMAEMLRSGCQIVQYRRGA